MGGLALSQAAIFAIALVTFGAILVRPFRLAEAWWALLGASVLVVFGLIPVAAAWQAVVRGADVYLFLLGMLLLAEILRVEGVFERLATQALRLAGSSQFVLFALVFGVGAGVTVFFSNDAAAVVLTRAVASVVGRARVSPYPYLFACAFVANAASFVLPISNPANLVVFGGGLPRLAAWLSIFAWPSLLAIALTFAVLFVAHRGRLGASLAVDAAGGASRLRASSAGERVASVACACAAVGMAAASLAGAPLGVSTFLLAVAAFLAVLWADGSLPRKALPGINYAIVPLVAGLFVIVAALDRAGGLGLLRGLFAHAHALGWPASALVAGGVVALACNVVNNLPVALGAASAFDAHTPPALRHAVLIAVDLGPNLAVSGSLATLLWMDALRREGIAMDALRFLRSGAMVALPALAAALLAAR